MFTIYRIGDKWRVGGGFTAVSQNKPANSVTTANRARCYVGADAMAEYSISEAASVKLNVDMAISALRCQNQQLTPAGTPESAEVVMMTSSFHNLLRMWADV